LNPDTPEKHILFYGADRFYIWLQTVDAVVVHVQETDIIDLCDTDDEEPHVWTYFGQRRAKRTRFGPQRAKRISDDGGPNVFRTMAGELYFGPRRSTRILEHGAPNAFRTKADGTSFGQRRAKRLSDNGGPNVF
jgi:hypothetical protein